MSLQASKNAPKILLSGASGLIGATLVRECAARRIQTLQLVREKPANDHEIVWAPQAATPIQEPGRLEGLWAAIHLSGSNLSSRRWTEAYKREIVESRVSTTRALVDVLARLQQPPTTLLCASATGIYGDRGGEILTEDSATGDGFLAETCRAWEAEAARATQAGIRVIFLRFGVVLAPDGGALKQMLPIFRLGVGGRLGSGRQWMSWIALSDLARAAFHLLETESVAGPVNLVAPNPVTNAEFTRSLGRALHRPVVVPAPAFALRLAFGEMADEALLASTRALPGRLTQSGFAFEYPDVDSALRAIL